MSSAEQVTMPLSERLIGQVKWFNNKAGYGFITVRDGEYANKDIFAHYKALRVTTSQYMYLVEGEYVEFDLVKSEGEKYEYQANSISGIKGGGLMCEVRNANRQNVVRDGDSKLPAQRRYRVPQDGDEKTPRAPRPEGRRKPDSRPKKNPTPSSE